LEAFKRTASKKNKKQQKNEIKGRKGKIREEKNI